MSRNTVLSLFSKTCSHCKLSAPEEGFVRKGKAWKTCNECSKKTYDQRKMESDYAAAGIYDSLGLNIEELHIGQPIGQPIRQFAHMVQQLEFDRQQSEQQRSERQWQQQRDQRMTLEYLLADPEVYDPTPLELYEQRRRLLHQTQQLCDTSSLQSQPDKEPIYRQNPQPELFLQPFPTYPVDPNLGMNQGMLPNYELLDPNFYCNFGADRQEQVIRRIDFEECLANAVRVGLAELQTDHGIEYSTFGELGFDIGLGQVDSMFLEQPNVPISSSHSYIEAMTDVDMVSSEQVITQEDISKTIAGVLRAQREVAVKHVRKPCSKLLPFSLDEFFADFDASADILRQPTSPNRDLTGAALATHLISELGLAIRLSELHRRWKTLKQTKLLQEVNLLDELEDKGSITPWGPLSDWFVMYQNSIEDVFDRYGHNSKLDWQTDRKVRAHMVVLVRKLKADLRREALQLIESNMEALFKLFVQETGQNEPKIKIELDKQLRRLKAAVAEDCEINGILRLKMGAQGTYVEG